MNLIHQLGSGYEPREWQIEEEEEAISVSIYFIGSHSKPNACLKTDMLLDLWAAMKQRAPTEATPSLLFRRCRSLKGTLGVGVFGLFSGAPKDRRQFHARLRFFRRCRDTRPKDDAKA